MLQLLMIMYAKIASYVEELTGAYPGHYSSNGWNG